MKKLFLVYLGGKAPGANIEVHDIQLVAANTIEETFDLLKANWFGLEKGLHIDSYREIKYVDGYEVIIGQASDLDLYLVQTGGHEENVHHEMHEIELMVGKELSDVRSRVKDEVYKDYLMQHIDSVVNLSEKILNDNLMIGFKKSDIKGKKTPDWFGFMRVE